jgi:preprotein translocase subunit SecE
MGNKAKNKNKQTTGGLQPKGGIQPKNDGLIDAMLDQGHVYDPNELASPENAELQKKTVERMEKNKAKEEKRLAKEKAKKEKKEKSAHKRSILKTLRETGSELKKVRWPTLGRTMKQTGVVLTVVLLFGVVVFLLDRGLGFLYDLLTRAWD